MNNPESIFLTIYDQLNAGRFAWFVLFGIVIIGTIIYLFRGVYIYSKRSVESGNFVVFCVPIIVWAFFISGWTILGWDNGAGTWARLVIVAMDLLIPPLFMLHIWSQVSYRPVTATVRASWLVIPVLIIVVHALEFLGLRLDMYLIVAYEISLVTLVTNIYLVIVLVKAYLLCFNVFYQMPKHMRRSTHHLITAITSIAVANGISAYFSFSQNGREVIIALAYIIVMYVLFKAFFIANSSNVIVTSRDLVFQNLSTIVITISLKGNILDWNHKKRDGCYPLPDPKYKEPYVVYRKRILETCDGAISAYDENIINIKVDKCEYHLMFTWHDISYSDCKFGYMVEIAEVTKSYSTLRYFEEIAYYDTLTSLHNRNAYVEHVKQVMTAENMPLLIAVGDVNNLKKVNDTYGHLVGDRLLKAVACAMRDKAPDGTFMSRIGGDEFIFLISNADESVATSFIATMKEALQEIDDPDFGTPSISWGSSVMRDVSENYNDVFRVADSIMYEAKRQSREVSIRGVVSQ